MFHTSISAHPSRRVGEINRRLFGAFVEHLGRCVYDGIYEPTHPLADAAGFRKDVIELVRELGVTTIRYPGGNFVSGYRWEDGVGPVAERPRRLDLAWHSLETNEVGLHEFAHWLKNFDSELMLAVNLGTRGIDAAIDLIEYTNVPGGTALSDGRSANGADDAFGVRMWCLGNEVDGPWQLGHRTAEDYGKLAAMTARAMRQVDPAIELVVCGSSGTMMPTFGAWERTVLENAYEEVEMISCHAYYEELNGDLDSFLASSVDMDHHIDSVIATADSVGAALRSSRRIDISFDEWNVWYLSRHRAEGVITGIDNWPVAPRLLEDVYSVADAVVVGSLLICLLRHADRVKSASLAQLVNVIAPIMTEPGGSSWRQTTFFPFATTARLATGVVLDTSIDVSTYSTAKFGSVPLVDAVTTYDEESGALSMFLVNRDSQHHAGVTIDLSAFGAVRLRECVTLSDDDVYAANTLTEPRRVGLHPNDTATVSGALIALELPPVSWTAISLAVI